MRIHLHLRTADLGATTSFYTRLLGQPDKTLPDLVRFQPAGMGLSLTLMEGTPLPRHPEEHFGLKVADSEALKALWARIEHTGLKPDRVEEGVSCCAAIQDKRWFRDPDGRPWEVYTVLDDSITEVKQVANEGDACCAPSCCA